MRLQLSTTLLLSMLCIISCKIKINGNIVDEPKAAVEQETQNNNTSTKPSTPSNPNSDEAKDCPTLIKKHDELFAKINETPSTCTKDDDCIVLNGFVGCKFAALAKNDKSALATFTSLKNLSEVRKCDFKICMMFRAFDAICDQSNKVCKLR